MYVCPVLPEAQSFGTSLRFAPLLLWLLFLPSRDNLGAQSTGIIAAGHAPQAGPKATAEGKGLKAKPGTRSPLIQKPESSCCWSAFLLGAEFYILQRVGTSGVP